MMKAALGVLILAAGTSCVAGNFITGLRNSIDIEALKDSVQLSELPEDPKEIAEFCGVSESGRVVGPLYGTAKSSYQIVREDDFWVIHWHHRGKYRPNSTMELAGAEIISDEKWRGVRSLTLRLARGKEDPKRGIRLRVVYPSKSRVDGNAYSHQAWFKTDHLAALDLAPTIGPVPRDAYCGSLALEHLLVRR